MSFRCFDSFSLDLNVSNIAPAAVSSSLSRLLCRLQRIFAVSAPNAIFFGASLHQCKPATVILGSLNTACET